MTDCDTVFDAPPEEQRLHLAQCPACARLQAALQLAGAPEPEPLSPEFFARMDLALERPDPIPIWAHTVRRMRQALTVAAALTAIITTGWVVKEIPSASQLSDRDVQRILHRASYR